MFVFMYIHVIISQSKEILIFDRIAWTHVTVGKHMIIVRFCFVNNKSQRLVYCLTCFIINV